MIAGVFGLFLVALTAWLPLLVRVWNPDPIGICGFNPVLDGDGGAGLRPPGFYRQARGADGNIWWIERGGHSGLACNAGAAWLRISGPSPPDSSPSVVDAGALPDFVSRLLRPVAPPPWELDPGFEISPANRPALDAAWQRSSREIVFAGWPISALVCQLPAEQMNSEVRADPHIPLPLREATYFGPARQIRLPLIPHWPGFAINWLFYATIAFLVLRASHGVGAWRASLRRRRGVCVRRRCRYPVGPGAAVCPECGTPQG